MKLQTFILGMVAIFAIAFFVEGNGCSVVYRPPAVHHAQYVQNYNHGVNYGHAYGYNNYAVATQYVPIPIAYPTFTVGYGENYGVKKELEELRAQIAGMNKNPVIVINGQGGVANPQQPAPQPAPPALEKPVPQKNVQQLSISGGLTKISCGECHSGSNVKGKFNLDNLTCESIGNGIEAVIKGDMPPKDKGGPFSPEKNGDIVMELTAALKRFK